MRFDQAPEEVMDSILRIVSELGWYKTDFLREIRGMLDCYAMLPFICHFRRNCK